MVSKNISSIFNTLDFLCYKEAELSHETEATLHEHETETTWITW